MEAGEVGTNVKPKASTSDSIGDSWWEERLLMAIFEKLVYSSWRIQRLALLFFMECVSRKSFLNKSLEYGFLSRGAIAEFFNGNFEVFDDACFCEEFRE